MEESHKEDGSPDRFLSGGGEMGERIRAFDWAKTPLGPIASWSPSLKMMARFLLVNRFPLLLWWGPQFIQIYNDPYRPVLGTKHPESGLGQPVSECWSEIWDILRPLIETPFNGGPATWMEDILLEINRYSFVEETHFTIAYSPVPDETVANGIGGVLATVHEITEKVVGERRLNVLRDLGSRTGEAKTAEEACSFAAQILAKHPNDIPFALLYLIDPDGQQASLAGAAGVIPGGPVSPLVIELATPTAEPQVWPLAETVQTESLQTVENLAGRFGEAVPKGPWADAPRQAVVAPIRSNIAHKLAGLLVVGISSRLRLDESYRSFIELAASQIATAVANARAYEVEKRRAEALVEIDRAKTAFFSNISHEFRTPLTLMLGPLEDALSGALDPALKEELEVVHRNGRRLLKLVNSLLDFSRIEAGRVQAFYQPTDLAMLTAELASVFRSAIERVGMELVVSCPALPEPVYVDREMWEKIVLNLLANAFKFTFEGSIRVSLQTADGQVALRVSDTGTGITETELPHLFERFHRIRGAQSRTHEGSGIGLALVQELVRLHGGSVKVESQVGKGTTFIVQIPTGSAHLPADRIGAPHTEASPARDTETYVEEALRWLPANGDWQSGLAGSPGAADCQASQPQQAITHTGSPIHIWQPRILLADDNADMRRYVERILSSHWTVEAVSDGRAALQAARKRVPDLVLTDVMMPGLDGFELLRELRADPRTRAVPVILLSARAGEESRLEGLSAGADDYLIKPFSARELLACISARLEIARLRREGEKRVLDILETLTDGFQALDANWRYTYVNPAVKRIWERQGISSDVLGKRLFDEVFPEALETDMGQAFVRAMTERLPVEIESFYPPFQRWYLVRCFPTHEGGISVFTQDITARQRAAEALRKSDEQVRQALTERLRLLQSARAAQAEAEQANRAKDEFLAVLSHELRAPLNAMKGWTQLLQAGLLTAEKAEQAIEVIARNVNLQNALIEDLLDVSRIVSGKMRLENETLSLLLTTRAAVEAARPAALKRQLSIESSFDADADKIFADKHRLQQIINNLLTNAIKFTPEGGTIQVRLECEGSSAKLVIQDSGIGIAPELLPHVFERFRQADASTTRKYGGLGLGLTIVKHLVELHGGAVEVHSDGEGLGTAFTVRLPLVPQALLHSGAETGNGASPEDNARPLENLRILLVDDDPDVIDLMSFALKARGAKLTCFGSAKAALEELGGQPLDLLISDLGMAEMDGYEFIRQVRSRISAEQLPAIALSGYVSADDRERVLESGFQTHLAKPVDLEALPLIVLNLLKKPQRPTSTMPDLGL
jgi:signal transduction histidine kinase/DNA-binding response OmpR family regulator